jgi:beta-glucosidase
MQNMHHNAHRLSIEWSRIERKEGQFHKYEIKHYRKVLEYMRSKGVKPIVTLFHFTLPHWFARKGGFLHPQGRLIFNRFVKRMAEDLGDLVDTWVTLNEPYVYANFGYWEGEWPPGEHSFRKMRKVLRELIHVHVDSYQTIREVYRKNHWERPRIGFAKSFIWFDTYKRNSFMNRKLVDFYHYNYNKAYFKPFYSGRWPLILGFGAVPKAKESLDFIGMNYYFKCTCKFSPFRNPFHLREHFAPDQERSLFNWEVSPEGLYYLLKLIYRKIEKPILITENGISTLDDSQRISYIIRHLDAANHAMQEGVDLKGYLHWSFIDNFEWSEGYTQFFGLNAMSHRTFDRIPKPSAQVFSEICKTGKITNNMVKKYAKELHERILE